LFLKPFPHCRLHLTQRLYSHQHTDHHKPFPHCTLHLTQRLTVLTSTHWSPQTISSLHTSPYPASYYTHINTLITTTHFLTAHFTLPSVLLYSHQHTGHHKSFPHCTLHLTQRLTAFTSTHWSPQPISSLHTSHYPASYCTHINTLITTNHFLTAHFTLPSALLHSHQHTDHHKPFPHCTLHFTQHLTLLTSTHWSPQTISSLHTSPYPASYSTHINTLINTNHFLTAHFTLPSVLLYSHQHTDHHKPFPHCTLHITQRLTVLTSTHWSPKTISSLHTSPYPASYCTHINTLITTNHFLTAHFTLPSVLLYSHQHTDHHKLFPHCTLHLTQRLTVLTSTHWSTQTISSLQNSPYPASYSTHINTLITTNYFLTAHFTLPSVLLYSHQHTDHHKPFPHCTLHLTQRLTLLTSTHWSPQTISSLHTSPYPAPYCTYINTLITINGLYSSVNFNRRNFFRSEEFNNSTLFEENVWKLFYFDVHWVRTVSIVCSRWSVMEERYHATTQKRFYPYMSILH